MPPFKKMRSGKQFEKLTASLRMQIQENCSQPDRHLEMKRKMIPITKTKS